MRVPVIFGFDLRELSFKAFSSKRMFDPRWHLRRERFIAYQVAMLIGLSAECTATYSLAKYEDLQTNYETNFPGAYFYQNDLIDCEISTIVFCVLVACVFGADFFFLLQFPRHKYPRWAQATKKGAAVLVTCGILASAIASTYMIATHTAVIGGIDAATVAVARARFHHPPWEYRTWSVNIAYIVQLWVAWIGCVVSTVLMFLAADWDEVHGPGPIGGDTESLRGTMPRDKRRVISPHGSLYEYDPAVPGASQAASAVALSGNAAGPAMQEAPTSHPGVRLVAGPPPPADRVVKL